MSSICQNCKDRWHDNCSGKQIDPSWCACQHKPHDETTINPEILNALYKEAYEILEPVEESAVWGDES